MITGKKVPPPAPDRETPHDVDSELVTSIADGFTEQYGHLLDEDERIAVIAREGPRAAYLRVRVGDVRHVVEFEVFVRDVAGAGLEGALGPAVDFLDGVLTEFFDEDRDASLPLDYVGHPYDDTVVYARQETRDLLAEAEAEKWLNA